MTASPKQPVSNRESREAEALRENLRKRKAQAQKRAMQDDKNKEPQTCR
ncbi:MAG: hypothetical protein KGI97_07375 [Alphaproteobacteria bacterium]|nr:hypothetical protein [Alphaproteobacteria bacterium]